MRRKLLEHSFQVGEHEPVPVLPPPVGQDPLGEHDHILRLLLAVDKDAAEAVPLDARHRRKSRGGGNAPPAASASVRAYLRTWVSQ